MVSKETSFRNHLEMADYTVNDDGMTVILKGSIGEQWTSKLQDVWVLNGAVFPEYYDVSP